MNVYIVTVTNENPTQTSLGQKEKNCYMVVEMSYGTKDKNWAGSQE